MADIRWGEIWQDQLSDLELLTVYIGILVCGFRPKNASEEELLFDSSCVPQHASQSGQCAWIWEEQTRIAVWSVWIVWFLQKNLTRSDRKITSRCSHGAGSLAATSCRRLGTAAIALVCRCLCGAWWIVGSPPGAGRTAWGYNGTKLVTSVIYNRL